MRAVVCASMGILGVAALAGGIAWSRHRPEPAAAVSERRSSQPVRIDIVNRISQGPFLTVESAPAGAEVWEDNLRLGTTPMRVMVAGSPAVRLTLRHEGYRDAEVLWERGAPEHLGRIVLLADH